MPLPYHAGKSKLAKTISKMVYKKVEENPSIKNYAEPFSGMARVGIQVMQDDKNKVFKKYIFSDVNPTISVLHKALHKGWLPNTKEVTQKKWESYKKTKNKPSAQKSFVGYTLGFGGQYFGGSHPTGNKHSVKPVKGKDWTEILLKRKKKYLKGLQPYFKSSKFVYKEKSVFDLDYKDTIIYCDPPYVATAFRAKKIWDKKKEKKLWNTIKKWLEPSKNNYVILSNSKRTNKMKGLRVKKIYEDDVEYGSWKKNWKKRKEMIFEVVNSSGKKTRKKRGGEMEIKKDRIYVLKEQHRQQRDKFAKVLEVVKESGYSSIRAKFASVPNDWGNDQIYEERLMFRGIFIARYREYIREQNNTLAQDGSGKHRRKKKTRKKRGAGNIFEDENHNPTEHKRNLLAIVKRLKEKIPFCYHSFPKSQTPTKEICLIIYLKTEGRELLSVEEERFIDHEDFNKYNIEDITCSCETTGCCSISGGKRRKKSTRKNKY